MPLTARYQIFSEWVPNAISSGAGSLDHKLINEVSKGVFSADAMAVWCRRRRAGKFDKAGIHVELKLLFETPNRISIFSRVILGCAYARRSLGFPLLKCEVMTLCFVFKPGGK